MEEYNFRYNETTQSWEQAGEDNSHLPTFNVQSGQWEGSGNPLVPLVNVDVAAPRHQVFSPMLLVPVPVPIPVVPVPSWIPYVPAPLVLPPPQYTNRLATQGSSGELGGEGTKRCGGGDREDVPVSGTGVATPFNVHNVCSSTNSVNLTVATHALPSRKRKLVPVKYPNCITCPLDDCGGIVESSRFREHVGRQHLPPQFNGLGVQDKLHMIRQLIDRTFGEGASFRDTLQLIPNFPEFNFKRDFNMHFEDDFRSSKETAEAIDKFLSFEGIYNLNNPSNIGHISHWSVVLRILMIADQSIRTWFHTLSVPTILSTEISSEIKELIDDMVQLVMVMEEKIDDDDILDIEPGEDFDDNTSDISDSILFSPLRHDVEIVRGVSACCQCPGYADAHFHVFRSRELLKKLGFVLPAVPSFRELMDSLGKCTGETDREELPLRLAIASVCDPHRYNLLLQGNNLELLQGDIRVRIAFGVHPKKVQQVLDPRDRSTFSCNFLRQLRDALTREGVVGFGEIGVDAAVGANLKTQLKHLRLLVVSVKDILVDRSLPIILHLREGPRMSYDHIASGVRKLLCEVLGNEHPVQLHCFKGSKLQMETWAGEFPNVMFSLTAGAMMREPVNSGVADMVANVPLDKLLIETDAPYLNVGGKGLPSTPHSIPGWIGHIAEMRKCCPWALLSGTLENCKRFFRVP